MALQATADASKRWHESQRVQRAEELQREQLLVAREAEHRAMKLAEAERAQRTQDLEAALTEQRVRVALSCTVPSLSFGRLARLVPASPGFPVVRCSLPLTAEWRRGCVGWECLCAACA